jgi:hypothetical protein
VFLLQKTNGHYYIHSSWSQSRSSTEDEWTAYCESQKALGEECVDWDEHDVNEIGHMPTTQGPFDESTLRSYLSNIKENLNTLFGLTESEIACVTDDFQHIDIQIFKGN